MTITLPKGGTVFGFAGAFGQPQILPEFLGGEVTDGNVYVPVQYSNYGVFDANVIDGMNKIDAVLHDNNYTGQKIIFAHSLGALAATRWLCDKGPTSDVDPSKVTFILLGNSGRRYGGIYNGQIDYGALLGDVLGIETKLVPVNTRYKVIDLAREYDGYADCPDNTQNIAALFNSLAGANNVHPFYENVSINDPANTSYVEGNVTYLLSPTYPTASLQQIAWFKDYVAQEDLKTRAIIDSAYDQPIPRPTITYPTTGDQWVPLNPPASPDPAAALEVIEATAKDIRKQNTALRKSKPLIRFWMNNPDGSEGLTYVGRVDHDDTIKGSFPFKNNTPSQGILELRDDHYMAMWLKALPNDPSLKKNVIITVDFYGGKKRWSGMLDKWTVKSKDHVKTLEVTFNDDLTMLQYLLCPPNPYLPIPVFQFPRVFTLGGPAKWCISTIILLNLMRVEGNWWTLPDDPFDLRQWEASFDWSKWQCLVKADPFLLDDSSVWTFLSSRMNPIDSVIADSLDDAQLTIQYRRILTDDGEVSDVPGVPNVQNGVLVFEVVDNSNATALEGTAWEGTIVDGFVRSVLLYGGGFVEDTLNVVRDDETLQPDEYYQSGWLATMAKMPWLVVRDNEWTPIESSELSWGPAKNVSVIVGGDNPAADAIAKLIIETTGNLIGYFLLAGFGSLGTIAAEIIMPFIVGTIAAWLQWKNTGRSTELGWAHYFELYQQGGESNAWSLSALTALRGGFLVGRSETQHTMALHDSWVIPGLHIDIGQRMGSTLDSKGIENIIWVNQLEEMTCAWDNSNNTPMQWLLKVGKSDRAMSIGERMARVAKKMSDALNNIGVHLVQT